MEKNSEEGNKGGSSCRSFQELNSWSAVLSQLGPGQRAGARGRAAPWMQRRAPDTAPRPLPACGSGRPGQCLHAARERQTDTPVKNPGSSLELDFRIICIIFRTQMSGTHSSDIHTYIVRARAHTLIRNSGGVLTRQWDIVAAGHLLVCLPCSRCALESRMPWGTSVLQESLLPGARHSLRTKERWFRTQSPSVCLATDYLARSLRLLTG